MGVTIKPKRPAAAGGVAVFIERDAGDMAETGR